MSKFNKEKLQKGDKVRVLNLREMREEPPGFAYQMMESIGQIFTVEYVIKDNLCLNIILEGQVFTYLDKWLEKVYE